jgi:tRNA (guanine9-N1)-methyltransferase
VNKNAVNPGHLYLTSYKGKMKGALDKFEAHRWNTVTLTEKHYLEEFPRESLVYLTGDSEHTMGEYDPNKIYIIGGLVDHNRFKNKTLSKANEE